MGEELISALSLFKKISVCEIPGDNTLPLSLQAPKGHMHLAE